MSQTLAETAGSVTQEASCRCSAVYSVLALMTNAVWCEQGLIIAPALMSISPTKTFVKPVGALDVSGAMGTQTLPALPQPEGRFSGPSIYLMQFCNGLTSQCAQLRIVLTAVFTACNVLL